jgi:putative ABC transport system permease protein
MFKSYLKIAVRNIRTNGIFSFVKIAGLSVGLTGCILILFYINDEWSFDRFHAQKDRIYQLVCERTEQDGASKKFSIAALVQGPAFKQEIPEIEAFTRVNAREIVVKKAAAVFTDQATWVDRSFFTIFSFPLVRGNPAAALTDLHGMVLTERVAIKYFGTADAVGKTLSLLINGRFEPFVVTGIAKQPPANSTIQFGILLSFDYFEKAYPDNGWMWVSFPTYFLLRPGSNTAVIGQKMDAVYHTRASDELDLNHLAGYHNDFRWSVKPMTGIATIILLIACVNFVNLTMAQSVTRSKEIGIRKVTGCKRSQLVTQFMSESLVVCVFSFFLALSLSILALPVFRRLADKQLSLAQLLDWQLLSCLVLLSVVTGFAAGFYPALVMSRLNPVEAFVGKAGAAGKDLVVRVLVVFQFMIATFLIIVMLFMHAQFTLLTTADLGYPDRDLLEYTIAQGVRDKTVMDFYETRIAGTPGVIGAGYRNVGRFGGKTQAAGKEFAAVYARINESFLPALGVKLVAGRNFSANFPADSTLSVLINQTFADKCGWKDPIGKTIDYMNVPGWGTRKVTVVGVVRDYHDGSLREMIQPVVFTADPALPLGRMIIRLRADRLANTVAELDKLVHGLDPDRPFEYTFVAEANLRRYAPENRWRQMITFGAGIAICLCCTGLFGLAMLSTQKRRKEIGIRKVLGCSVTRISVLLVRNFVSLVLIAFLLAVPLGTFVMRHWLLNFAYRVDLSWWRFGLAGLMALLVAVLAVGYQAVKAAKANPVESLRSQ